MMNNQMCFLFKAGLVATLSLMGVSMSADARPLFPKTLPASSSLISPLFDSLTADINGDGNIDLVAVNVVSNTISIGLGDGSFNLTGSPYEAFRQVLFLVCREASLHRISLPLSVSIPI